MTDAHSYIGDKVVVVTGAARGIGLATAKELHRRGAKVAVGDIDEAALKAAAGAADFAFYQPLDVTDPQSYTAFLDAVEGQLGPVDVLVNNAGVMPVGAIVDEPETVTRRILDINVYGVILGSKLAARRMAARGHGHVINVASLAAVTPIAGLATYCASKHAVLGFTESLRIEYRPTGVEFSTVLPTFTNTELIDGLIAPKGLRNAEPNEIASAIADLISRPRRRVVVTRAAGVVSALHRALPHELGQLLTRLIGTERSFIDGVDATDRKRYEDRARGSAAERQ